MPTVPMPGAPSNSLAARPNQGHPSKPRSDRAPLVARALGVFSPCLFDGAHHALPCVTCHLCCFASSHLQRVSKFLENGKLVLPWVNTLQHCLYERSSLSVTTAYRRPQSLSARPCTRHELPHVLKADKQVSLHLCSHPNLLSLKPLPSKTQNRLLNVHGLTAPSFHDTPHWLESSLQSEGSTEGQAPF